MLNILAMRISVAKCIDIINASRNNEVVDNLNLIKETTKYQSHAVGGSQTSASPPHASPHHNSFELLNTTTVTLLDICFTRCSYVDFVTLQINCCLDF